MKISSPSFLHEEFIPDAFTCEGKNANPELIFEEIPQNIKSLALIMDDPDAPNGTFVHWVMWNIPKDTRTIPESFASENVEEGVNSRGGNGYTGPYPPEGTTHRYFFKLYALDTLLDLDKSAGKEELEAAMKDHVLDSAELVGIYGR